jgi:hypothetical protein
MKGGEGRGEGGEERGREGRGKGGKRKGGEIGRWHH